MQIFVDKIDTQTFGEKKVRSDNFIEINRYINTSVVKSHHKFMFASYMKQIAKFLSTFAS